MNFRRRVEKLEKRLAPTKREGLLFVLTRFEVDKLTGEVTETVTETRLGAVSTRFGSGSQMSTSERR